MDMPKNMDELVEWRKNYQYEKVEFPVSDDDLRTFAEILRSFDLGYFESCLNASCVREEDIERIAFVKRCLEQFNDVIPSRIAFLEEHCGLVFDTSSEALYEKYFA